MREKEREKDRQTDRQTDRQRQRERETDRQTDRQTHKEGVIEKERERKHRGHYKRRTETKIRKLKCVRERRRIGEGARISVALRKAGEVDKLSDTDRRLPKQ